LRPSVKYDGPILLGPKTTPSPGFCLAWERAAHNRGRTICGPTTAGRKWRESHPQISCSLCALSCALRTSVRFSTNSFDLACRLPERRQLAPALFGGVFAAALCVHGKNVVLTHLTSTNGPPLQAGNRPVMGLDSPSARLFGYEKPAPLASPALRSLPTFAEEDANLKYFRDLAETRNYSLGRPVAAVCPTARTVIYPRRRLGPSCDSTNFRCPPPRTRVAHAGAIAQARRGKTTAEERPVANAPASHSRASPVSISPRTAPLPVTLRPALRSEPCRPQGYKAPEKLIETALPDARSRRCLGRRTSRHWLATAARRALTTELPRPFHATAEFVAQEKWIAARATGGRDSRCSPPGNR
jgi:hypothetical protein